MDVLDWLNSVLGETRWISTPDEALAIVLDVGVDAPVLVRVGSSHDGVDRFPVAFADVLRAPVAEFMAARLSEQIEDGVGEQIGDITPERLASDKLVLALSSLLIEGAELSQRSSSLVMLELARQTAAISSGNVADLGRRYPAQKAQLDRLLPRLAKFEPTKRGAALAKVAWSLSARLSFSWAMAGRLNPAVRPTRMHQAIVRNKLALVVAHGGLELPRDLGLVAAVSGVRTSQEHLNAVHAGLVGALKHALGDDSAAAKTLRSLAGTRKDAHALALDPAIAGWVLNALKDVAPSRVLQSAGVDRDQLKVLTDRRAVPALASAWQRMCRAIRTWDLLTTAASMCLPIDLSTGTARSVMGELRDGRPWSLLVPKGQGGHQEVHAVVVDRSQVYDAAVAKAADRGVAVFAALSGVWTGLRDEAESSGGVLSPVSGPWFAAFEEVGAAREFKRTVERRLRAPIQLDLAPLGPVVSLASGASAMCTVVSGTAIGGWDGSRLYLRGPAVDMAGGEAPLGQPKAGGSFIPAPPPVAPAPKSDLGEMLSSRKQPPPEKQSRPVIESEPLADPFASGEDTGPSDIGFGFSDGPREPVAAEPLNDPFAKAGDFEPSDSGLSLGGDDPFGAAEPEPIRPLAAADPSSAAPQAPTSSTPSLPPEPIADPSAFDDIEADPLAGAPSGFSLADDPLVSNPPLGEDRLGLTGPDLGPDPFEASMDDDPSISNMEIVDDDDSEFTHDPESGGIFFIPPPPDAEIPTTEDPSGRTLIPETSGDAPLPADPANLLNLDATDSQFGFTEGAAEALQDTVEQFVEDSEVVIDQPSQDRDDLHLDGGDAAGFMVAGPAPDPEPPEPEEEDPFATGSAGETAVPEDDPFGARPDLEMSTDELRHLFDGYVSFVFDGQTVVGRLYGEHRVVDVHRYETLDLDEALARFIQEKASERFVAQTEAQMVVPKGAETAPLDTDQLKGALSSVSG
ncbi:MAG: hypothetical protein GY884_05195 [Proteobacteria bacterium]|nr:hypothetical protein [Pseudomonadota bacterium]